MKNTKFIVRQILKMLVQSVVLPIIYKIYRHGKVDENLVIFADSHQSQLPKNMENMYCAMSERGYNVVGRFVDYQAISFFQVIVEMVQFMKLYAQAKYVFLCDNFLPVASCNKRKETVVIQLWHAGGILKKYGYDTPDDIPLFYKGNVYKNYDVVTVSAPICTPVYMSAMRLRRENVLVSGLSKTDLYLDTAYIQKCKQEFYDTFPQAKDKKIILWAPTFRGKANNPSMIGEEIIEQMKEVLKENWIVIIKAHPHVDAKKQISNCDIQTERLLPVIDVLITDYSSVIFDYSMYLKPLILFVPDRQEYEKKRGFYIGLEEIPGRIVEDGNCLAKEVCNEYMKFDRNKMFEFSNKYMLNCDGHATERIINHIKNL